MKKMSSSLMEESVEDKVQNLQNCLDALRQEVEKKMQIMEQILNTRNEQFVLQKTLIEKEHAVYENVLSQWKNSGGLSSPISSNLSGQANFSRYFRNIPDVSTNQNSSYPLSVKRASSSSTTLASGAYSERLRHKAKRLRTLPPPVDLDPDGDTVEDDSYSDLDNTCVTELAQDSNLLDAEVMDLNSGGDSEDGDYETTENGMEKRVFVNFYSESAQVQSTDVVSSSDPIWLHFLHEENGSTALCKHCDEKGFQQMYKLKTPSMALLRRHLKKKHKIIVETPMLPVPGKVDTLEQTRKDGRRRFMPFLRHNDYLYTRKSHRNAVEYWNCREKMCTGRVVKRPGNIQITSEHNCLTTAADCEAILFRTRIREMAEAEPTLPPSEVIAAAKIGLPEDVLEIVPNDDSLRGTIRRIRQALDSVASATSDWT